MDEKNISKQQDVQEQEIDLVEVIRKLWKNRKFILKVTIICMILGVFVALFSPKQYSAGCTFVPQTGEKSSGGGLSGLAAMAGISLGDMGGGELLSPKVYPIILSSVPFKKDLMYTPLNFQGIDHPVTLFDFYTNEEYQKFNLLGFIQRYTIGLPGLILGAIMPKDTATFSAGSGSSIQSLNRDEKDVAEALDQIVTLNLNEKEGYIKLAATLPEPLAVAQLAQTAQGLLQKYVTEFKIEKVASNLEFIQGRYDEAQRNFEAKQEELAQFRDANKALSSNVYKTREEKLTAEYNLLYGVYSELAKQLEQAKISVKETTPILTIVEPVVIPLERSKPKRALICIAFTFLGAFLGIGLVLTLPFVAQVTGWKRIENWKTPEKEEE